MRKPTIQKAAGKRLTEILGYSVFYLLCFHLLEQRSTRYVILDSPFDHQIPFCPVFIVPYLLWFVYLCFTLGWFALFCTSDEDYYHLSRSLAFGCTVFLLVSAFFPNGQQLRPHLTQQSGLLQQAVRLLYATDTPTNVFPSIHVFNSVVCCEAILHQRQLKQYPLLTGFTVVLTVLIIASTLFLKQHTLLDVAGGLILAFYTIRTFGCQKSACFQKKSGLFAQTPRF